MQSNFIYSFLQSLPTNGWTTAIGGVSLIVFGISGMITGHLTIMDGGTSISAGIAALGLGNKFAKIESATAQVANIVQLVTPQAVTPDTSSVVAPTPLP